MKNINKSQTFTWRRYVALLSAGLTLFASVQPAWAGGYTVGKSLIEPFNQFRLDSQSLLKPLLPTYNNDFFNNKSFISVIHNDPFRTPFTNDPISTVSGNNFHEETDVQIRGRNELNYGFTRTYNSEMRKKDSAMGYGWTHSYMMKLKSNDFIASCPNCSSTDKPENADNTTSSITYTDERGGDHNYSVAASTLAVTPPKGEYSTLSLNTPSTGLHTLTFRNGVSYVFETASGATLGTTPNVVARLKQIKNPWGDQLNLTYDTTAWPGKLLTVADNLGITSATAPTTVNDGVSTWSRSGLAFTYHPTTNKLKDVTDWTGRKWAFTYDASGNLETMANPLNQVLTYVYRVPALHLLNNVKKPLTRGGKSVETRFTYYENGRGFQQTDSSDRGDTLDYDLYRQSTRVTDARGGVKQFFYDSNGGMTRLDEPDGAILLFENQDDSALRFKKTDALGYSTTYSYNTAADRPIGPSVVSNSNGNVTREKDAFGYTIDTTYNSTFYDQVERVKDKRGNETFTTFYATTDATTKKLTGKPEHEKIKTLTWEGTAKSDVILKTHGWNADGTLSKTTEQFTPTLNERTRLTTYEYQAGSNGLNVSAIQTEGRTAVGGTTPTTDIARTSFTYDRLGRVKTKSVQRRTSPTNSALLTLTTYYDYDSLDRVIKTTDVLGNEVLNSFDANGQLWQVTHRYKRTDGTGTYEVRNVVTRTFDANDRVLTETDAQNNVTSYTYDESGNRTSVTDANGHTSRIEYDAMNRQTAVVDATGYRTTMAYNQRGDLVSVTNALGQTVTHEYDAVGNKTATVDAKGYRTAYQYDENGNLKCLIDANAQNTPTLKNSLGCTQSTAYDELGRVIKTTNALNGETSFTYDLLGNRLTVKDAKAKTWSFAYNELGYLKSQTDHRSKTTNYLTDQTGLVYQTTNRLNQITKTTYDNAGRVKQVDYYDGTWQKHGYDLAGNLNSLSNGSGTTTALTYSFAYDSVNRLQSKVDSRGRSLSFTYDKVGNILTKSTYQGTTTYYTYNASDRLVELRNPDYVQATYHYDPAGRLSSRVMSSEARTHYEYDKNGWLSKIAQINAKGVPLVMFEYQRDRVGNITQQRYSGYNPEWAQEAVATTTYQYDALHRLRDKNDPVADLDETFTYDAVGNRETWTIAGGTYAYVYESGTNRLKEIRANSATGPVGYCYEYDDEGRRTAEKIGSGAACGTAVSQSYTWDAKGRMKSLSVPGAFTETYQYDPTDMRIARRSGPRNDLDYFLEGEHLESVYNPSGLLIEKYLRGVTTDELLAGWKRISLSDGTKLRPFLFHHDANNSVRIVTDPNGDAPVATSSAGASQPWQWINYMAFGLDTSDLNSTAAINPTSNLLKYTGREYDGTGLYYYRARYYDPYVGRFISEDPMGFDAGDVNFYAYVGNNPINANDPSGKIALVDNAIGGLIGAGFEVASQWNEARKAGRDFGFNDIDGGKVAIAGAIGFATSGASAVLAGRVGAMTANAGWSALGSRVATTATNAVVGGAGSAGQTATVNALYNENKSVAQSFAWGAAFGAVGSVVGDAVVARSFAREMAPFNAQPFGQRNIVEGVLKTSGARFSPSPLTVSGGSAFGNFVGGFSSFAPVSEVPRISFPSQSISSQIGRVYGKR